jgi:HSP20 family protein
MANLRKDKEKKRSRLVHRRPFAAMEDIVGGNLPSDRAGVQKADTRENDEAHEWRPSAEISETDTEYLVRVGLPAVRIEDMKVRLDGDVLTISGERHPREGRETDRASGVERCDECYSRSFTLPRDIQREAVRWEFKDQALTVTLPRKPVEAN